MKDIVVNEWKGFWRSRVFMILLLVFIVALLLTTYLGIVQNHKQIISQKEAQEHIRKQWDDMDPSNPHRAAHFGSYAFKPATVLNSIDEGINSVTGNVLRLEGHVQNDVMFSESSQSLLISSFGKLKPSLLFQFIIPLFLIFLSFNSYTRERETGRLKMIIIQGMSLRKILFSKIISIWLVGVLLLFITIFMQLIFNADNLNLDMFLRLLLLLLSYGIYYLVLINLTILFSVIFKNSTGALSLIIVMWVIWTVFFPKIIGNTVEKISPLPTRVDFQHAMTEDRSKGIDGHNPSGARQQELEKAILEEYNVNNISELPINFTGIVMQADEEYGNKVWDKHFGNLYSQLQKQKKYYQISGVLNPFASLQSLSMGISGTDMFYHLDFLSQAEKYRRVFIRTLNDEYAYGGSLTGDRGWKASSTFFQSIKDFEYVFPKFTTFWTQYLIDIINLFFWLSVSGIFLSYSSRKISTI